MISVLIAEDSAVVASHLRQLLESDPELHVLAVARNGLEAVSMAHSLKPDVITMDILMPKMDGVEATKTIMRECPTRIIIVTGSADQVESRPAFEAIKEGALTVLEKPRGHGHRDYSSIRDNLVKTVKTMSEVKVVTRWGRQVPAAVRPARKTETPKIIAIGASTGGPAALSVILKALPVNLSVPIMIVQHMTTGFGPAFAGWLNQESALPVRIAEEGERLIAGSVYIAPDNTHAEITADSRIVLTETYAKKSYHRPSINCLFETVAREFHGHAIGVLLTGMGEDGASGLQQIKAAGGKTFCQDEETSIVFGMPRAAIAMGAPDTVLPISKMGAALSQLVGVSKLKHQEKINV